MTRNPSPSPGTITLIGSGEMSPSMGKAHRAVLSRIAEPVQAVFLDTPAGFELNADQISAKATQYFLQHLNLDLAIASFKASTAATPDQTNNALRKLWRANYIFAGPGSPTYTIRNWRDTTILAAMAQRLAGGAHLVFASAAAIAIGRYALPVYEIYKVGTAPHWNDGLDLPGPYGLELAIIPHWNNNSGRTHDTRYCFMGKPRMEFLEKRLPDSTTILGIDEYTACTMDLGDGECRVIGTGQVTIRQKGRDDRCHPAGNSFALNELRAGRPLEKSATTHEPTTSECLAPWIDWPDTPGNDDAESVAPFIDLLVQTRSRLRAGEQWALADEIRQQLAELGITLKDSPTETVWKRA